MSVGYRGWIDGLAVQRVSATSVKITAGGCDIPSIPANYDGGGALNAETTLTPSRTASAWQYVYAYASTTSYTPAFEVCTTEPVVYFGTARHKTGDASRRYIGAFLTDGSSNIYDFRRRGDEVRWLEAPGSAPFRVLLSG